MRLRLGWRVRWAGVRQALAGAVLIALAGCGGKAPPAGAPGAQPSALAQQPAVFWNAATVYFLLTDRFNNGDTRNDHALGRQQDGAVLRSYEGGDFAGIRRKIEDGWFDSLGVDAIWLTPFVEQVHGSVDEGTGRTYGYHGYWASDWTAIDPALGSKADLRAMVDAAHRHGMRVLMDAVINHTGPTTPVDPQWPDSWVRTTPLCTYRSYTTTVDCALVASLPDIRTESDAPVELPPQLVEKWRREGRLAQEQASLDTFFQRTGYPRAPRYYVIKWLTDWVREFGFDGYRVDTAKHFGEAVSAELKHEAEIAFADWKQAHPQQALDDMPFFMVGEVFGWSPGQGRNFDFGDKQVDFFAHGYDGLINFAFKAQAAGSMDSVFGSYSDVLQGPLSGEVILNYVTSHDDGHPLDLERRDPYGAGTRLLLAPGGAQVYYGDELARPLQIAGTQGDANLRSFMNWDSLSAPGRATEVLRHWRRLGQFRQRHPAVGAGVHHRLQSQPYVFSRTLDAAGLRDRVVIGLGLGSGAKNVPVSGVFADGLELLDSYSGERAIVIGGHVMLQSPYDLVLLAQPTGADRQSFAGPVRLHVDNRSPVQLDMYVLANNTQYRLGNVSPGMKADFVVPQGLMSTGGRIEFMAQLTGASAQNGQIPKVFSGQFTLTPGSIVDFDIAPVPSNSTARIRP